MIKFYLFIILIICPFVLSFGQEGMWLLSQLDRMDLKEKGLSVDAKDIFNPDGACLTDAIIQLGGGTASFVSPEGLILTNHHVAYTALQRVSTAQNDYLQNGFLAKDRSEEIPAPGYVASVVIEMKDVTGEIMKAVEDIKDPMELDQEINNLIRKMTSSVEEGKDDISAVVSEMYNGRQYILFVYKQYKDIRIVYAPPLSVGNFGGDIDNWMWPRHTGDFSFMRAYMAPDGKGREYNTENVPVKPEVWLKTSSDELDENDMTFVLGFPGFTTRYRTSNSVGWNLKKNYPQTIKDFQEVIDLMDELTKNSPDGKIKVADLRSNLANTLKNYEGKIEAMTRTNYLQKKIDFEYEFQNWINSDELRKQKYGHILPGIKELYRTLESTKAKDDALGLFGFLAGNLTSLAGQIYNISKEFDKPEADRNPGFTPEALEAGRDQLQYIYMGYYEPVDKAMLVRALKIANELPEISRLKGLEYIFKDGSKSIEQFVDEAYKNSEFADEKFAKSVYGKPLKELMSLNDPFIKLAAGLYDDFNESAEINNEFGIKVTDLRKQYINALYEWKGQSLYPDANGSIRFTSGNVAGYRPKDAVWYYPFTTLTGVVEKETNKNPFDVPDEIIKAYNEKDFGRWVDPELEDVPVAFLHRCDITGGSSGSPVLNARGELIGLVFDGNYEALISDWQYDNKLQRTISVDIRYVLFITEKLGKAYNILKEMGL